jgi:NADH-quinone oxidoreductase subunit N
LGLYEQLREIQGNLLFLGPEICLIIIFFVYLVAELILTRKYGIEKSTGTLQTFSLYGAIPLLLILAGQWQSSSQPLFGGMLFLDQKAVFFKLLVTLAWLFTMVHIRVMKYKFPPEINAMLIVILAGLYFLSMSTHFLLIYLSVELVSFCSYMLVAIAPGRKSAEGAMKYLLFGGVSSAIMLYGISLIYGLTGTFSILDGQLGEILSMNTPIVYYAAIFMMIGGLLFKLSLAPFHLWTPDVYEATPNPLVSFLSVAPKAAVILVIMRLASVLPIELLTLLGGVALLSMTLGNVGALWQNNTKRLLAYSTISQAGYLIVGIVAYSQQGFESTVFYTAAYVLINMAVFYAVDVLQPRSESLITDYAGQGRALPLTGVSITFLMIALAGLPPTVGFTAKWLVFSSLWGSYNITGFNWQLVLLIGGILNAAIALVYYIKIPYQLFFKSVPTEKAADKGSPVMHWLVAVLSAIVLFLFFKPSILLEFINQL